MKTLKSIIVAAIVIFTGSFLGSCTEEDLTKPVVPQIDIEKVINVEAVGGIVEIPLVSSYPWYATTNASWIKMETFRGQMKIPQKIVINVKPNPSSEVREGSIQIKLMDQMIQDIIVSQKGK